MSTFDWFMFIVGLLSAMGGILHRAKLLDPSKVIGLAWIVPILTFGVPPTLMILGMLVGTLTRNDHALDILLVAMAVSACVAPVIGLFSIMVLWVRGSVGRDGWQHNKIRYVLVFSCLDIVLPVLIVAAFIVLALLRRAVVA